MINSINWGKCHLMGYLWFMSEDSFICLPSVWNQNNITTICRYIKILSYIFPRKSRPFSYNKGSWEPVYMETDSRRVIFFKMVHRSSSRNRIFYYKKGFLLARVANSRLRWSQTRKVMESTEKSIPGRVLNDIFRNYTS